MDINVKAFQDAITEDNYEHSEQTITPAALAKQGLEAALAPVFTAVQQAIQAGKLIAAQLVVTSPEPTTIRLETGIINLPFADVKKVANFLEAEEMVPLKVYLIVSSEFVNVSGLRIDEVTTADEYLTSFSTQNAAIIAAVSEKLAAIETNRTAPKEVAKEVPASRAKTTSRRTTTRKTATRKATARKTTTRKTTAKKTTTRKPKA